ncbi:hypothetical protein [uncultured Christiangramia sp.]|uniref:hypothetical protein n=1 Tax=uncultured Christiangramia sp. TaxID=503836 RepID=UPI0025DFF299|nr:hypothetical protein [uncultured Christiangramia sp.]|tara:strand:+ start:559 stop:1278 length:720 start_codon:yes stop_codon:yes gene_type:complete
MNFDIITYLLSFGFIYIYSRLAIHYLPVIYSHFLNENLSLVNSVEKPRLLFHFTGLSFMHLMSNFHHSNQTSNLAVQLIIVLVYLLGLYFCLTSWRENFKSSFLKKIISNSDKSPNNFNLSISDIHLTQLYNEMVRFDLIDQEATSLLDFKNVLLEDWGNQRSRIHLKMDGPSCREFYDHLIKTFPHNSITLKNLFVTSGLLIRPDGKKYNYNTLKNAPTRSPISKQHEALEAIFQKFK